MIEILNVEFVRGALPVDPVSSDVALEAGVSEDQAAAMIAAAWQQAETLCNRTFYPVTAGEVIARVRTFDVFHWPRHPFPASLKVEVLIDGEWQAHTETYIAGMIELEGPTTYRLTQPDPITPPPPGPHVIQAVFNLALYQLIQSPARREFRSQAAGDSSLTRESLLPVFQGSGAGAMLAGEVRL